MNNKIYQYPHEILRAKSVDVAVDHETKNIANLLTETMSKSGGIGLAAPQIGISKRIIVVAEQGIQLANPVILEREGRVLSWEGCLSIDGLFGYVERYDQIIVEYTDMNNENTMLCTSGILSRVIQHEIDHLNGILIIDKMKDNPNRNVLYG